MKKKGFTLVELLAVIVILAIIALISTPIILGVIEKARIGAAEQSALGYIDAVEKQIVYNQVKENQTEIVDKTYTVEELKKLGVSIKGTIPNSGSVTIKNGTIKNYILGIGEYTVNNGKATKVESTKKYANGTAVYYNPETNKKCSESDAVSKTGTKSGCMKWYTFNDEEGNTIVNMILDHNTTTNVAWNSEGSNSEMKEVATALKNDTTNWDSSLNARLITANEVAKITGNTTFDASKTGQSWFCLDTNQSDSTTWCSKTQGTSKYAWLFDYTNGCASYGCNKEESSTYGYWTNTPYIANSANAWVIHRSGYINDIIASTTYAGIRPVITISKSTIK